MLFYDQQRRCLYLQSGPAGQACEEQHIQQQEHQDQFPCAEDYAQRAGPDHLDQNDEDKPGEQLADQLHKKLHNVIELLNEPGHLFYLPGQNQQRAADYHRQQNDLQGISCLEGRDDVRGNEIQHHLQQAVQLCSAAGLLGKPQGEKRKSQQTGQNTDQGKQLQEVEQHPFADPTEGGSIADSANSPGHRQENHGTGNGSQHIEECFVERTQKLIQHGCPACFRQQKSGETHNDRGSGSEGQTQQGVGFFAFSA